MSLTLAMVTCDSLDPVSLAAWWADQVGGEVADPYDGEYLLLSGGPVMLAFQKVDDPTPGKNRLHLDLTASDLDAEVDRLLAAGAGLVERRGDASFRWVTLTDPHGNEFCVAERETN
jgi:Glyoxalase-like domain